MGCNLSQRRTYLKNVAWCRSSPKKTIPLYIIFLFIFLPKITNSAALASPRSRTVSPYEGHVERVKSSQVDGSMNSLGRSRPTFVRHYRLHSRCSGRHVMMFGRVVNASASSNSRFARLRVETDSFDSRVRIQNAITREYLCFNNDGRLVIKHSGSGNRCLFNELHTTNDFTEFRSMANHDWFIGFNTKGKRLSGDQWLKSDRPIRARKCYQFTKTDLSLNPKGTGNSWSRSDSQNPTNVGLNRWYSQLADGKRDKVV